MVNSVNGFDSAQVEALEWLLSNGDLDEVEADEVRAESLQAGEEILSDTVVRRGVFKESDTDETTQIDFDTGVLSEPMESYEVRVKIAGHGGGASGNVDLTLNGDTTANYNYNHIANGTVASTIGDTKFRETVFDTQAYTVGWDIATGDGSIEPTSNDFPSVAQAAGGDAERQHIINGVLTGSDYDLVDRMRVQTDFPARGSITILGEEKQ